jgi:hypothetical protein
MSLMTGESFGEAFRFLWGGLGCVEAERGLWVGAPGERGMIIVRPVEARRDEAFSQFGSVFSLS